MRVGICRSDSSTGRRKEYHFGPMMPILVDVFERAVGLVFVVIQVDVEFVVCEIDFKSLIAFDDWMLCWSSRDSGGDISFIYILYPFAISLTSVGSSRDNASSSRGPSDGSVERARKCKTTKSHASTCVTISQTSPSMTSILLTEILGTSAKQLRELVLLRDYMSIWMSRRVYVVLATTAFLETITLAMSKSAREGKSVSRDAW